MRIVKAGPEDAGELSAIARAAKARWGYPESWLSSWEKALTLTPDSIRAHPTYRITADGHTIGFFALVLSGREAHLDHLWVLPSETGRGAGRLLFEFAAKLAREAGASTLRVESDPHAEDFYIHMGATRYGQVAASMDGTERHLPLLELAL